MSVPLHHLESQLLDPGVDGLRRFFCKSLLHRVDVLEGDLWNPSHQVSLVDTEVHRYPRNAAEGRHADFLILEGGRFLE